MFFKFEVIIHIKELLFFVGFKQVWSCCVIVVIAFILCSGGGVCKLRFWAFRPLLEPTHRAFQSQIAKTFKILSFKLDKGEISPYSDLERSLEQALGCI